MADDMADDMENKTDCRHKKHIPIDVESNDAPAWCHWCTDCGAVSSESSDIDQPKDPWFMPGELSDEDVARINRAARGE